MITQFTHEVFELEDTIQRQIQFPSFDKEQKEVRLKYNLIEE